MNVEFDRVPFPALGDQSAAWSMSEHLSIASISASIVVVRKGNYVVLLVLFGSDSGTTSTLKGLADMAIGKVN